MSDDDKKSGTRVFKKTSPNGKITSYLGKRDFIDHGDHVDLIDGMVLVDTGYVTDDKKVFATLMAAFRYGREDLDVLGLTFRKDLITQTVQVYPPLASNQHRALSKLQERLKKKLGQHAYPFWFDIPPRSASSVTLQPAAGDTGKPCGVDYELKTYVSGDSSSSTAATAGGTNTTAGSTDQKPKKHSTVRLAIRKLTYAPADRTKPQPSCEVSKEFMMSPGLLHLEASLDKEMYYHGESISVNVTVQNNSNKSAKKIKVYVQQVADICLFTTASYTCEVAKVDSSEGFPVSPGGTLSKVYILCPLLSNNKEKRGLALDGQLKHEDTNLASSTIMPQGVLKENLGIIVQYKVKIKLSVTGPLGGELTTELPFTLTHPKPTESPEPSLRASHGSGAGGAVTGGGSAVLNAVEQNNRASSALEMNLIELDTTADGPTDDDLIFEDFTRLRLRNNSEDHD